MTSELRPAALVAHEACEEMEEYGPTFAERVIKADRQQAVAAEVAQIVAGLKSENGQCDCSARSEGECACGAWDDYKTWPLERVWEWIERGEYKETSSE